MRGDFLGVWSQSWNEIWHPLQLSADDLSPELSLLLADLELPEDFEPSAELFSGLYVAAYEAFADSFRGEGDESVEVDGRYKLVGEIDVAAIANDPALAEKEFASIHPSLFKSEHHLARFFEEAYEVVEEFHEALAARYQVLLAAFIEKYSLRYELRKPCELCPTLPGMFASLVRRLKMSVSHDPHLAELMRDFEDAVADLRNDASDRRIKTCLVKQVNLIEAIACLHPEANQQTFGRICNSLTTWPHDSVRESLKNLYRFTCDYPGIRHGGSPANAMRAIDMRDMLCVSVLMVGFLPYLSNEIDADMVYRGDSDEPSGARPAGAA